MKEMKRRTEIKQNETKDKQEVQKETKRSDQVVKDAGKVDSADKKIALKGTEEGARDVTSAVSKAMDETKKVHQRLDSELGKKFDTIREVEEDLESRSTEMKKDADSIKREQSGMASNDTKGAKQEMSDAAKKAEEDQRFLHEASDSEKKTRESGQKEMKQQKSQIGKLKTRKR